MCVSIDLQVNRQRQPLDLEGAPYVKSNCWQKPTIFFWGAGLCQKCSLSLFLPYMSVCFRLIHMPHVHLKMARRHSAAFGPRDPFCHISFQLIWCYVISLLSHRPGIAGRDRHLTNREGGAKEVWSDTLLKAITCGNLVQVLFGVACRSTTLVAEHFEFGDLWTFGCRLI